MGNTIHVVAHFSVKKKFIEAFIAAANRLLVEPTVSEPGCQRYELCQNAADETRFAMIETSDSEETLNAHLSQPSLATAFDELRPFVSAPPDVHRLRPAG